jgi:hypothetical protein
MQGIASWLHELAGVLELDLRELMPIPAVESKVVVVRGRGLKLTMHHPHAGYVYEGDADRWVLTDAEFGLAKQFGENWNAPLPFGIDATASTPCLLAEILSDVVAGLTPGSLSERDLWQTYFLKDGRALGVRWKAGLVGVDAVHVTRLGMYVPYKQV